jgi:hypothetical protein
MHPDRIEIAGRIAAPPGERRGTRHVTLVRPRIVGFGAPVSMRIRLDAVEVPRLRAQVVRFLEHAQRPEAAVPVASAWQEMLDQLPFRCHGQGLEVLWPTVYAYPVLRAAVDDALDALEEARRDARGLEVLAAEVSAVRAAVETLRAFLAVDRGGLQDVAL